MSNEDTTVSEKEEVVSYVAVISFLYYLIRESNVEVSRFFEALNLAKGNQLFLERNGKVRFDEGRLLDQAKLMAKTYLCKEE